MIDDHSINCSKNTRITFGSEEYRDEITTAFNILTENFHVKLNKIPKGEIKEAYDLVFNSFQNLVQSKYSKSDAVILRQLIYSQYRPSKIKSETIGSFLFGCFQTNYGEVPKYCSPICTDGLNIQKEQDCSKQIWIFDNSQENNNQDNNLRMIGSNKRSLEANIYLNNLTHQQFEGFTSKELKILKDHGVERVTLYYESFSRYFPMSKQMLISKVPIRKTTDLPNIYQLLFDKENNKGWGGTVFIVILVIILSLIICFFIYFNKSRLNNVNQFENYYSMNFQK